MKPTPAHSPAVIVLAVFAGAELLALVAAAFVWQPAFRHMFADLGGAPPRATAVVLSPAFALGAALLVAGLAAAALLLRRAPRGRLVLLVAALVVGLAAPAAIVAGSYLPIFKLSSAVRTE